MARNYPKICLSCGRNFDSGALTKTCSPSCRVFLKRLLDSGKNPPYLLLAISAEKKTNLNVLSKKAGIKEPKKEKETEKPEIPKEESEITLTADQKLLKTAELNVKLATLKKEKCPMSEHPKRWLLMHEIKVSDLEEEIQNLKNK